MKTHKPHHEAVATSSLKAVTDTVIDGVLSGLESVVGAVQGALGIGHTAELTHESVKPSVPIQKVKSADISTAAAKRSRLPKQSKSSRVKAKALKTPKRKMSRVNQAKRTSISKSKTL